MMKAGIIIEPLVMKEWIEIMQETQEDATNTLARMWLEHNMDRFVCHRLSSEHPRFYTHNFFDGKEHTVESTLTPEF